MRNIFIELEYVGTNYFGFQLQDKNHAGEITVQEMVERALEKLFNRKIRIIYSSRTDRGVHAKAQSINFKTDSRIPFKNIKQALNTFLPGDIRVKKVKEVPPDFHARFNVKSKIYRYIILNKKDPSVFQNNFCWHLGRALDLERMRAVARLLAGKQDFSLFAKHPDNYKNSVRDIKNIAIKNKGTFVYIDIEADGFMHNMARNIVSFLVKTGSGKLTLAQAKSIIIRKVPYHNEPAPASGLYLQKVNY
jgi:tRNA pseudouridine38-40 synthase